MPKECTILIVDNCPSCGSSEIYATYHRGVPKSKTEYYVSLPTLKSFLIDNNGEINLHCTDCDYTMNTAGGNVKRAIDSWNRLSKAYQQREAERQDAEVYEDYEES